MRQAAMPAGCRRRAERREADGPAAVGFCGWMPGYRRGCSLFASAVRLIPAVEGLLGWMRHLTVSAPGVEAIVDDKPRQMRESHIGGGDRRAIRRRPRQQFTGRLHLDPLGQWRFVPLDEYSSPRIDLLVDIDLDRADIAAAAVQCRSKRQVAVFALVEGRIDDQPDRAGIGSTVAEAAAAPVDRAGVHAGAAADAFERGPELLHTQTFGAAVIDEHDVHLAAGARPAEMRGVLRDRRAERAARQQAHEHRQMLQAWD